MVMKILSLALQFANSKLNSEIKWTQFEHVRSAICMVGCIRSVSHEFMFNSSSDAYVQGRCRQPARQLWNTAIVIFIFYGYKIMNLGEIDLGWSVMKVLWNTWWVCEDWMSLYTSEWHHQDFGYISFVEITKNDECSAEVCLCARTSVSVWYRICWLLCHAFSLGMSVTPFKSTLKTSTEEERGREEWSSEMKAEDGTGILSGRLKWMAVSEKERGMNCRYSDTKATGERTNRWRK